MTNMLDGKVVVITGGSSGIGRGIAFSARSHGAKCIVIADLMPEPREGGEPTHVVLAKDGIDAVFVECDVTSSAALDAVMEAARERGGVDLMVCNAGIALPDDGPNISAERFRQLISVNLEGAALSAQKAISQMKELRKQGSVVFTSSMGGLKGSAVTVGYSATKGAVNLLTASLADAHGPGGIRVNAVCPGLIETDLVKSSPAVGEMFEPMRMRMPLRRLGQPGEVGDVVAWLGSSYSTFVTGVSLPVDGGQTAVV